MEQFTFELKNDKKLTYTRMRYLMELIGAVFFMVCLHSRTKWYGIVCFLVLFVLLEWDLKKNQEKQVTIIVLTYSMLAFGWLLINGWMALLHVLLLALNIIAVRKLQVVATAKGITYPSFPANKIQWDELQNVIYKDGILTIDFKNDKLLQVDVDNTLIDETSFNQYCRQQLEIK
jgi:hypothetical protein